MSARDHGRRLLPVLAALLLGCAPRPQRLAGADASATTSSPATAPVSRAAPGPSADPPVAVDLVAARQCFAAVGSVAERPLKRPIAPVMSYLGADWLDRADRDETDKPDQLVAALGVRSGDAVADIGAGSGYFTLRLARRVAPAGVVFAVDVQPEMLAMIERRARAAEIGNIVRVQSTARDLKLAEGSLDLALLVDVYHEMEAPSLALAQLKCALKPGGRAVFVEFREEDPTVAIKPEHKMSLAGVREEVESAGFTFVEAPRLLPRQHVVVFRR